MPPRKSRSSKKASSESSQIAARRQISDKRRFRVQTRQLRLSSTDVDEVVTTIPTAMIGELPPFNDWQSWVVDDKREMLYIYGGCGYDDDTNTPTSDFYECDIEKWRWKNLTHQLQFRCPYDPFANEDTQAHKKSLPALQNPACACLNMNGRHFMFMFGGYDLGKGSASSEMIAIDLDDRAWWYVKIQGGPINSRMGSCMVAINNRLYIFGGRKEFGDVSPTFSSYCIAEYSADGGNWSWIACDHPYPPHVPSLGHEGKATSIYDGKKILLTPGRIKNTGPTDILKETTLVFHTENHTFHPVIETVGDFPTGALWYEAFSSCQHKPLPASRTRRPSTKLQAASSQSSVDSTLAGPSRSAPSLPSVILCCWIPHLDGYVVPDIWQYLLPPEEKITCLNLRQTLWDLDLDMQGFVVINNRMFLFGNDNPESQKTGSSAVWNICVEIRLGS